jgi:Ala-tRNA(Pro) deacylase
MPMTIQEEPVHARLSSLGIAFARYEHEPAATVQEAEEHWAAIDAMHFKNLFVRNQKGTRHYLLIVRHSKRADLRAIADQIGDGKLSFGSPERLMTHLGVTPGSVSPFGLINDGDHSVRVVIDRDLKSADRVSFHPNINTVTLTVARVDFERFLAGCGNPVQYVAV